MNSITLNCKPYVAHFLKVVYPHRTYKNKVHLPPSSNIRHTFLSALSKRFHPSSSHNLAVFTAEVEVVIRQNDFSQFGNCIDPSIHFHLNTIIEEMIKNQLFFTITTFRTNGASLQKSIQLYKEQYAFSEEVFSTEAIAQAYHRCTLKSKKILQNCHKRKPCTIQP